MAFDTGEVGRLADNFRYVRFGSLADILTSPRHVRFTPNNGRWRRTTSSRGSLRSAPGSRSRSSRLRWSDCICAPSPKRRSGRLDCTSDRSRVSLRTNQCILSAMIPSMMITPESKFAISAKSCRAWRTRIRNRSSPVVASYCARSRLLSQLVYRASIAISPNAPVVNMKMPSIVCQDFSPLRRHIRMARDQQARRDRFAQMPQDGREAVSAGRQGTGGLAGLPRPSVSSRPPRGRGEGDLAAAHSLAPLPRRIAGERFASCRRSNP